MSINTLGQMENRGQAEGRVIPDLSQNALGAPFCAMVRKGVAMKNSSTGPHRIISGFRN